MNANEISSTASRRMRRIQNVSRFVWVLFRVALILEGIAIAACVIVLPITIAHWGFNSDTTFKNLCSLLLLPIALVVTLNFFRLFGRLKDGHLFEGQTIRYLETAGKWWIVLGVLQAILVIVEAHFYNPHKFIVTGDGIFGGLVVFFIAWVMREAQELKEEQQLTV